MLDVRGYSRSTRPKEMSPSADQNAPIVSTEVASSDVGAVVDHVLKRRNLSKVNLIGWSWGTAIMGHYASTHPKKVQRLVLYAPVWLLITASLTTPECKIGAYRAVQPNAALARWLTGVPEDKKASLIPAGCGQSDGCIPSRAHAIPSPPKTSFAYQHRYEWRSLPTAREIVLPCSSSPATGRDKECDEHRMQRMTGNLNYALRVLGHSPSLRRCIGVLASFEKAA
jgi:hypothetical protein